MKLNLQLKESKMKGLQNISKLPIRDETQAQFRNLGVVRMHYLLKIYMICPIILTQNPLKWRMMNALKTLA